MLPCVQHVNSLDNHYERWVKRFYDVGTKYLENYLNWFIFLENVKKSLSPVNDLAMLVASNTNGINNYHAVENKYAKLINLQYSKITNPN